jgi:transcriptional regulator with GAF, ATPase, and Fis domain
MKPGRIVSTFDKKTAGYKSIQGERAAKSLTEDVVDRLAEPPSSFETLLADLSKALAGIAPADVEREVARWLDRIAQELCAERCTVGEFCTDGLWVAGRQPTPFIDPEASWIRDRLSAGQSVVVSSLDELPDEQASTQALLKEIGIRSGLWLPISINGAVTGGVGLTTVSREQTWSPLIIGRCQLVCSVIGSTMFMRRQMEEIRGLEQFEALVGEISTTLINADAIDSLIDQILQELGEFLHAHRVSVVEVDSAAKKMLVTRQRFIDRDPEEGFRERVELPLYIDVASRFPWLAGEVLANRIVAIHDVEQLPEEAGAERDYCESADIGSFAMVPAALGGSVVVALTLENFVAPRIWSDRLMQRLHIIGELIAGAEARARTLQDVEELRRFESAIARVSTAFVNLPPEAVDSTMEERMEVVAKALDVDLITLLRPHGKTGFLVSYEWSSDRLKDGFKGTEVEDSFPWLGECLLAGQVLAISKLADFPEEAQIERTAMEGRGLASVLWVPFRIRGELAGYLTVNTIAERTWSVELYPKLQLLGEVFGEALKRRDAELELRRSFATIKTLKEELERENVYLRQEVELINSTGEIIGDSPALRAALAKAEQVAPTDSTVLILGETGTGKELMARAIHGGSPRKDRVLVTVNCAALPSSLVEAELFGREKGAFTGALTREAGRFEIADGGTILLDEIGELSFELQAKLLRVLQDGEFERLGSSKTLKVDVRVLAATNRDLLKAVEDKEFREDLYYRLNVFPIELPPLRERTEDIPQLVWAFVQEFAQTMGKGIETVPRATMDALQAYRWPGNVREVRNIIERAMIISQGPVLEVELPIGDSTAAGTQYSSRRLEDIEREHIRSVVESSGWRIRGAGGAAEILGLKPTTLEARMKKLGLQRSR